MWQQEFTWFFVLLRSLLTRGSIVTYGYLCGLQLLQTITCDGNDLMVTRRTSRRALAGCDDAGHRRCGADAAHRTTAELPYFRRPASLAGHPQILGDVVSNVPFALPRFLGPVVLAQAEL